MSHHTHWRETHKLAAHVSAHTHTPPSVHTLLPRIWLIAALSFRVHSATTFALISFMYNMKAFRGFLIWGLFGSCSFLCSCWGFLKRGGGRGKEERKASIYLQPKKTPPKWEFPISGCSEIAPENVHFGGYVPSPFTAFQRTDLVQGVRLMGT